MSQPHQLPVERVMVMHLFLSLSTLQAACQREGGVPRFLEDLPKALYCLESDIFEVDEFGNPIAVAQRVLAELGQVGSSEHNQRKLLLDAYTESRLFFPAPDEDYPQSLKRLFKEHRLKVPVMPDCNCGVNACDHLVEAVLKRNPFAQLTVFTRDGRPRSIPRIG